MLRYAHLLRAKGKPVRCFIAAKYRPQDASWIELCADLGVSLIWPEVMQSAVA